MFRMKDAFLINNYIKCKKCVLKTTSMTIIINVNWMQFIIIQFHVISLINNVILTVSMYCNKVNKVKIIKFKI